MSFARPSLSDLIARAEADVVSRMPGADSRLRRSTLDVLVRTHAGAMHAAYGLLDEISRFLPDVAEADRLGRWASIFGLSRKAAQPAAGAVSAVGSNGAVVPEGSILIRSDGIRFVTTAAATIAAGVGLLPVTAEQPGASAATAAGQPLALLSAISGVQAGTIVAAPGLLGGVDQEDDEALRARLLGRIRAPVRGGAANDYAVWAVEVAEVTRAWVYENWNGLGTVKVLFVCDNRANIIPLGGDVAAVAAHIAGLRPVCAEVTVAAPAAAPLNLSIGLSPDTAAVRTAVEAELRDLVAREAVPGGALLISHIREAVSLAAGEVDHIISSPTANVTAAAGNISTLGAITWTGSV